MAKSNEDKEKKSIRTILITLMKELDLKSLPPYKRFNITCSAFLVVLIFILTLQPTLTLLNNLLITIGNVFITIFSNRDTIQRNDNSDLLSLFLCIIFLIIEMIVCRIYCYHALKLQNSNKRGKSDAEHNTEEIASV